MKITSFLTAGALASAMASPVVMADNNTFTPEQKKQIEQVIHDYLVGKPEVLMEASQALQAKQQETMQKEAKSAIGKYAPELLSAKLAVAGNSKGNVTVVEFFDNQCIHCKKMDPIIVEMIKKNPDVRVVYKEFPIFGKNSEFASKAALAAAMQGKYIPFHEALLRLDKPLDNDVVLETAKTAGLDMTKLKTDMDSKVVSDELDATHKLADHMHLMGTPAFVILTTPGGVFKVGSEPSFIPGGTSAESLQGMIDKAAAAGK